MDNIGFLETMLEYYLPGLDASTLSEEVFIKKVAHLLTIRSLEANDKASNILKSIIGE